MGTFVPIFLNLLYCARIFYRNATKIAQCFLLRVGKCADTYTLCLGESDEVLAFDNDALFDERIFAEIFCKQGSRVAVASVD
jgi:hypothetical protein